MSTEVSEYVRNYKHWLARQRELAAMIGTPLPPMTDKEPPPLPLMRAAEALTEIWYTPSDEVNMDLLAAAIDLLDQALSDYRKEYGRVD